MGTTTKDVSCNIPLLRGSGADFQNWSYRVRLFLEAKGVADVLTEVAPTEQDAKMKFEETDRISKALLVGCLSDECLEIVREKATTKEMWVSLEAAYAKKSIASQTLVRKQLARLRMKEGGDMRTHLLEFDGLVRKLKMAGATLAESDLVSQLFLTLPDSFDPLVTALENVAEEDLNLDLVKQRLLAEERKRSDRQGDSVEDKSAAFSGNSRSQKKSQKFLGKCHKCGRRGHMKKDCRQREANSAKKDAISFMADANIAEKRPGRILFKLDSGCSDHLVGDKFVFASLKKMTSCVEIKVAKEGEAMLAEQIGEINATSNKGVLFNLKNVLYVPELRENLISVRKMANAGIDVLFSGNVAVLKKSGKLLATGHLRGSLYELELSLEEVEANHCEESIGNLWHRRLGHINQRGLETMARKGMLKGMNEKTTKIDFCDACVQAKQCREPFNGTRTRASRPLERIHSDVCGPIDPPAWDGSRYIVSFIDDHTHFSMIYLLKRKSEVFEKFQEFEAKVTAMLGKSISRMTVDQGREYCSTNQMEFYKRKGIQLETTVAYTPQQNGVAERFNRTLIEKVRSVLIQSKVPKQLWSEAALACVYLMNRSPTSALPSGVTPAEMWFGIRQDLDKLRVFGCKSFVWIPKQQRRKLDAKSKEMVMVGYAPNGYRVWDPVARKLTIARDVKFDESSFPYAVMQQEDDVPLTVHFLFEQEGERCQPAPTDKIREANDEPEDNRIEAEYDDDLEEPVEEPENALPSPTERREIPSELSSRHSGRERRLPGKLFDYFIGYRAISGELISADIPESFDELPQRADRAMWIAAVQDELRSMEENKVWRLTSCPKGVKPLKSKWVFRLKDDSAGNAVKHKARLVVKGFLQKAGVDYEETFAPVAKLTTIRTVLAAGVQQCFHFHQMDVKTAFLHGDLKEELYMAVPDGVAASPNTVCRLLKSLYGLKQSPRCWNEKFNDRLLSLGFRRSLHDYCLYVRVVPGDEMYIILYVDDLLIAGRKIETIVNLKKALSSTFKMTDCGEISRFLGMKLEYDRATNSMKLSQETNIEKILIRFKMTDCNPTKTPMEKNLVVSRDGESTQEPYRELLGTIMYVMLCTRPDLCFPVGFLGRYQQNPTVNHWQCLKRIVRYLKGTKTKHLKFVRDESAETLVGYADADWASDAEDRKSVSGYLFTVFGNPVSWSSKKQVTVSTSSSEAEYVSLSSAVSEAIWLSGVMEDLQLKRPADPVVIFEDNQGAIGMAKNCESKRSKHIDIKHHFIRDHIANGRVAVKYISTEKQLADLFTKPVDAVRMEKLCQGLGMAD